VLEEVVSEAICVVVMMRRPIVCEEHLMGAFWTAVRLLLRHRSEGRHGIRVGSRARVEFETVAVRAVAADPGPDEVVELKDRVARATDFVAQLSEFEREVVAVMAVRGAGVKLTARILGVPVKSVRAAERSARSKLDRVAVIAAAGRMCSYREGTIVAYASGSACGEQELMARAHLAACAPCRRSYTRMMREMQSREFQGGAAAAFLPAPVFPLGHHLGVLGRMLGWTTDRPMPFGGPGERAAEVLGGAGVVKVAAAGSAVVVATATLASGIHPLATFSGSHSQRDHHRAQTAASHTTAQPLIAANPAGEVSVATQAGASVRQSLGSSHLTPQEHAALEFSSPRGSPSHSFRPLTASALTASAASLRTSSVSGTGVSDAERSESSATSGESSVDSGPSAAAREFQQP